MSCLLLVCIRVFHHSVLPDESLSTDVAGERFFPRVQTHVSPQIRLVVKLFRAHFTLVRFVPRVFGHVFLIEDLHGKSLATLCALKGLFSVVKRLIVLLQVTYSIEYFIAFIAPKFACVIFHVTVRSIASLRTGPQFVQPSFHGSELVPGEHRAKAVVLHTGIGVGYVCEGVALW